jgi:hypothetical protein
MSIFKRNLGSLFDNRILACYCAYMPRKDRLDGLGALHRRSPQRAVLLVEPETRHQHGGTASEVKIVRLTLTLPVDSGGAG